MNKYNSATLGGFSKISAQIQIIFQNHKCVHSVGKVDANYRAVPLCFLLFFAFVSQSFAQPSLIMDADKQFNFARHCFEKQEYSMAVSEYKRFIYFFPKDDRVESAMFDIAMSYFKSKRLKNALKNFKALTNQYKQDDVIIKSYFMISKCHAELNEFSLAISNLHNIIALTKNQDLTDKAYYKIGWIYLEMASWEKAVFYFNKISPQNKNNYKLEKLSDKLDKAKTIDKKSPMTAGLLSVLPGAGYVYCERYHDALAAFLLNGGLICAAYESFDNGDNALGGLIAFFEAGFYSANIYGSITSAHKYNKTKIRRFIEKLKKDTKIRFSARKDDGIAICLQYKF